MNRLKNLLPVSIKKDDNINIISEIIDSKLTDINNEISSALILSRINELSGIILDILGWQFHVDFWKKELTDESKRELIKDSIKWHRIKGTPGAVKLLLSNIGFKDVEIIEAWKAKEIADKIEVPELDGSWKLDGSVKLSSFEQLTGIPYLNHWAYFIVKTNLTEGKWKDWDKDLKWAVELAKNERSWPKYLFWVFFEILVNPYFEEYFYLSKNIDQPYPWCTKKIDGSWKIGIDDKIITLDGKKLDGTWHLGEILKGLAYIKLRQCNIFYNFDFSKEINTSEKYIIPKIGEKYLKLNNVWQLGKNPIFPLGESRLSKDVNIYTEKNIVKDDVYLWEFKYPKNPFKLSSIVKLNFRRLGNFKIGKNIWERKLDGKWQIINEKNFEIIKDRKIIKEIHTGIYKKLRQIDELEKLKVDGGWKLGRKKLYKGNEKVFFKLDGAWKVGEVDYQVKSEKNIEKQISIEKKQQVFSEYSDKKSIQIAYPGSSKLGTIKKLSKWNRLDGSWNIGEAFGNNLGDFALGRDVGIISESKCFAEFYGEIGIFRKLGSPFFKVGEYRFRKVNGAWKVSAYKKLDGEWKLNEGVILSAPHLGKIYTKLNKSLQLGATKRLNGSWKIGITGIEAK